MMFWDSSALVPVAVDEAYTPRVHELLDADPDLAIWWGSSVECASAVARLSREGVLDARGEQQARRVLDTVFAAAAAVRPTERVRASALRLVRVHELRAADALQLAAALEWAEGGSEHRRLVTLDHRLATAGRDEGFDVQPDLRLA